MQPARLRRGAALAATAAILASLTGPAAAPAAGVASDLTGDSRADLVLGLPWVDDPAARAAGAVAVVEGSKDRLFGAVHRFDRAALGLPVGSGPYAGAGTGIASGDFDGDGTADLAAGAPGAGENGAVAIVYGSPGLRAERRATFAGTDRGAAFGSSLVAGDLNGDGYADLAVSAPGTDPRADADYGAGAVHVLYGGAAGLTETGRVKLARPDGAFDAFGSHLALGDTDGDGKLDLHEAAEGTPQWSDDPPIPGHLSVAGRSVESAMQGGPASLATGDVNGDGHQDLVAGIPTNAYVGEDDRAPSGAVRVYFGGRDGLSAAHATISQRTARIPGSSEPGDLFGLSVAVARIDRDRYADIVVGAPGEDGTRGRVTIVRGGPGRSGHARKGHFAFAQDAAGVPGRRRAGGRFGASVSLLDLSGDGRRDLAIAAPGADGGTGTVTALRGGKGGFAGDARRLRIRSAGVAAETGYAWPETRLGRHGAS
ncbi:MAG TPA: FG-GAP-like repeat-containing protein [Solirubrobacteraceae bacterium]|jgi:hypothetical protein